MSIGFASFEDNAPIALVVDYFVDSQGNATAPEFARVKGPKILSEDYGQISGILADKSWMKHDFLPHPIDATDELIQAEIAEGNRERSHLVGPPISIVRIKRGSSGFIPGHKGDCTK